MASVVEKVGDWVVTMEWPDGTANGGPSRMVIEPIDKMPVGGLSSTVLRQINFRDALGSLPAAINSAANPQAELAAMREFERDALQSAFSKGATTDDYLALLSSVYLNRVSAGQEKPVDRIAEELGRSLATVKGHLWQARRRGLLVGGSAGRKGGELSDEADKLVEAYALEWLDKLDKISGETITVEHDLLRADEDKPKRRRPKKAITPRTET